MGAAPVQGRDNPSVTTGYVFYASVSAQPCLRRAPRAQRVEVHTLPYDRVVLVDSRRTPHRQRGGVSGFTSQLAVPARETVSDHLADRASCLGTDLSAVACGRRRSTQRVSSAAYHKRRS